jgi:hypothetical protein
VLNIRGSFTDGFLLMTGLALSSVLVVLLFHQPDDDRQHSDRLISTLSCVPVAPIVQRAHHAAAAPVPWT